MNGSSNQRRDEPHDEDLGLGLVDELTSTTPAQDRTKPRGWIFAVVGIVIVVVLALVIFSLVRPENNDTSALKAQDAVANTLELRSGGSATLTTSQEANSIAVELFGLPALDETENYVVWGIDDEGNATVILETEAADGDGGITPANTLHAVYVTVETAPIPDVPSSDPELAVDLPLAPQDPAQEDSPAEDS